MIESETKWVPVYFYLWTKMRKDHESNRTGTMKIMKMPIKENENENKNIRGWTLGIEVEDFNHVEWERGGHEEKRGWSKP